MMKTKKISQKSYIQHEAATLSKLEQLVYNRKYELAVQELTLLLNILKLGGTFIETSNTERHFTRLAAAISTLLTDPEFTLTEQSYNTLKEYHHTITSIFVVSAFDNTLHILMLHRGAGMNTTAAQQPLIFKNDSERRKFLLIFNLYCANNTHPYAACYVAPELALSTALSLLSHKVSISICSHEQREQLLGQFCSLVAQLPNPKLKNQDLEHFSQVWMFCSYALRPDKHEIKITLNQLLRDWMKGNGITAAKTHKKCTIKKKPTLLINLELFNSHHAMYRCYAPFILSLAARFKLIAIISKGFIDEKAKALFEEVIEILCRPSEIEIFVKQIKEIQPDLIYYPSIGMNVWTIALANLRLAPIQFATLGHPATTHSPYIDYILMSEKVLGKNTDKCFSETIVTYNIGEGLPFTAPQNLDRPLPEINEKPDVIHFAVPGRSFKISPSFLKICQQIHKSCSRPVFFHFFPNEQGVSYYHIKKEIEAWLPLSKVYPTTDYCEYIRNLNQCDIHLSCFPFGNSNGNVDSVRQGIPILCLDGPEAHSRFDVALSKVVGLPNWLSPNTPADYVKAAVKLVEKDDIRVAISHNLISKNIDSILFKNKKEDTTDFVNLVWWLYNNHEKIKWDERTVWRSTERNRV